MHEICDYVTTKPELNEETLAHYGIKGMKWKKRLKGAYYSTKSKMQEQLAKKARGKIMANITTRDARNTKDWGKEEKHSRVDNGSVTTRPDNTWANRKPFTRKKKKKLFSEKSEVTTLIVNGKVYKNKKKK